MKANEYKCAMCGNIYEKGRSDEEARQEAIESFGELAEADCDIVCDDCYNKIKPSEHPEELAAAKREFSEVEKELAKTNRDYNRIISAMEKAIDKALNINNQNERT